MAPINSTLVRRFSDAQELAAPRPLTKSRIYETVRDHLPVLSPRTLSLTNVLLYAANPSWHGTATLVRVHDFTIQTGLLIAQVSASIQDHCSTLRGALPALPLRCASVHFAGYTHYIIVDRLTSLTPISFSMRTILIAMFTP